MINKTSDSSIQNHNIDLLNAALDGVELTQEEEKSLFWLSGYETSTIKNIISAFQKRS